MENNLIIYQQRSISKTTTWLLFLFLGWSYGSMNKMGLQILYYLTLGGFGVWMFLRLFFLSEEINNYNLNIAKECELDENQIKLLGLDLSKTKPLFTKSKFMILYILCLGLVFYFFFPVFTTIAWNTINLIIAGFVLFVLIALPSFLNKNS